MLFNRSQFSFFGKREINALYATLALISLGEGIISIFVPIFLWKTGFALWQILFFFFLMSFYFVISSFLLLPLLERLSDKMMLFLSVPFLILYFFFLNYMVSFPILFYILPLFYALNTLFFNIGYNLDFAQSVDKEKIGRKIGTRNTVSALVNFGAPFIGGLLIVTFGFGNTFLISSIILFISVLPLFFFPYRHLAPALKKSEIVKFLTGRGIQNFNMSCIGYSNETLIGGIIWPLFIFFAIHNLETLGGVISIGLLASVITTYFFGFLSDAGDRRKILGITTILFALIWVGRLFFTTRTAIISSNILGNVVVAALLVAWTSQYYKISRAVDDPSVFILSREILYNLARIALLPVLIWVAYAFPLYVFFVISFGFAAIFQLFYLFANRFHLNHLADM